MFFSIQVALLNFFSNISYNGLHRNSDVNVLEYFFVLTNV